NKYYAWGSLDSRLTGTQHRVVKFTSGDDGAAYGDSGVAENGVSLSPINPALTLGVVGTPWGGMVSTFPLKDANAITYMLGKTSSGDTVRQFTSSEVKTFLALTSADVTLQDGAVAYGKNGKVFGDATKLAYDETKFSVLTTSLSEVAYFAGHIRVDRTIPSGVASFGSARLAVADASPH